MERAHQRRKGHLPSRPEAGAFVRPRRTLRLGSRSASQVPDTTLRGGHSHIPSAGLRTRSLNRSLSNGLACDSVSAERTAKTSPPSPDPEDQPAAKRRAYPPYPENHQRRAYQEAQSLFTHTYLRAASLYGHGSHQAALALLQHARSVPPGCRRAEPPAYPAPHPPLPPAVAQAVLKAEAKAEAEGVAEAEARGQAEAEAIERGGQGEGGHSEGELDRILQEQLARLRSSWSHAS